MTRRLISGATVVVALLAAAPAASADDASLFNAYNARQHQIDDAADRYSRAVRRATRRGTARAFRGIVRANNRMNGILATIKSELAAQPASSAHGRRARVRAFREVRWWRRANSFESRAIQVGLRGHSARARSLFRRADRTMVRAGRAGRGAVREFKAVGLTSPLGPISVEMG
jgi:hypothetical protein